MIDCVCPFAFLLKKLLQTCDIPEITPWSCQSLFRNDVLAPLIVKRTERGAFPGFPLSYYCVGYGKNGGVVVMLRYLLGRRVIDATIKEIKLFVVVVTVEGSRKRVAYPDHPF